MWCCAGNGCSQTRVCSEEASGDAQSLRTSQGNCPMGTSVWCREDWRSNSCIIPNTRGLSHGRATRRCREVDVSLQGEALTPRPGSAPPGWGTAVAGVTAPGVVALAAKVPAQAVRTGLCQVGPEEDCILRASCPEASAFPFTLGL